MAVAYQVEGEGEGLCSHIQGEGEEGGTGEGVMGDPQEEEGAELCRRCSGEGEDRRGD